MIHVTQTSKSSVLLKISNLTLSEVISLYSDVIKKRVFWDYPTIYHTEARKFDNDVTVRQKRLITVLVDTHNEQHNNIFTLFHPTDQTYIQQTYFRMSVFLTFSLSVFF